MLQIRRAKLADELQLLALVVQFPTPTPPSSEAFSHSFRVKLKDPDSFIAVAELDSKLIGYVSGDAHETFYAGGKTAWVDEILVAPAARRQGVGRALMAEFENWAESSRCRLVGFATRNAASFYEDLGFKTSGGYFKRYLTPGERGRSAI